MGGTHYSPLHCFDCDKLRGIASKRHDAIRDCLVDIIKKVNRDASVQIEQPVENYTQRPDIRVFTAATTMYLDVSVTNPSAPSAITNVRSDITADAANRVREQAKRNHYAAWEDNVQPFVLEATGRLGPMALQYLQYLTENAGQHRPSFIQKFQATLAKYNGLMFTRWIDNISR